MAGKWYGKRMSEPTADQIVRVLDILAPYDERIGERIPIFEWGHETTPKPDEIEALARRIVTALLEGG